MKAKKFARYHRVLNCLLITKRNTVSLHPAINIMTNQYLDEVDTLDDVDIDDDVDTELEVDTLKVKISDH